VHVYAVDGKGRTVPQTEGEVTFDVKGAARLIAVDNGNHNSDELFAGNKRLLYQGTALGILRAARQPGEVTIKASVPGLRSITQKIKTQP
jgi:beta-galactosidase